MPEASEQRPGECESCGECVPRWCPKCERAVCNWFDTDGSMNRHKRCSAPTVSHQASVDRVRTDLAETVRLLDRDPVVPRPPSSAARNVQMVATFRTVFRGGVIVAAPRTLFRFRARGLEKVYVGPQAGLLKWPFE
jgi:hypothetical protein